MEGFPFTGAEVKYSYVASDYGATSMQKLVLKYKP
jgi:hypothetical protein